MAQGQSTVLNAFRRQVIRGGLPLVLPLCLLATAAATFGVYRTSAGRDQVRFRSAVQWTTDAIQQRIAVYSALLRGAAALYSTTPTVEDSQFKRYVARLRIQDAYKGVQGVGFAMCVRASEQLSFQREGEPEISIRPVTDSPEFFPIVALEPQDERNRHALGYDMFSEPVRRAAMERARDLAEPAASGKVILVQEIFDEKQAGFLIYVPVYRGGAVPETMEQRRAELKGFVYSPFRADDLFSNMFGAEEPRLHFDVYDRSAAAENLLHSSPVQASAIPQLKDSSKVVIAGQPWVIQFATSPEFEKHSTKSLVWWALGTGLVLTTLLTRITLSLDKARAQAELARHEAQAERERYRVTLASIGDAVIATDPRGCVAFMNTTAETLTGWAAADALGQPSHQVLSLLEEASRAPAANLVQRVLAGAPRAHLNTPALLASKDGTERPILESAAPIRERSGALIGVVLVFRDISEERLAEQARAKLAAIVESSDDAIISQDLNGIVTSWNAGAERVYGFTASQMAGQTVACLMPEGRFEEETSTLESIRQGKAVTHFETVRRRSDGRQIAVSLTVSPIRDPSGAIVGVSKIARDITDRKAAEAELRQAQERLRAHAQELETAVAERTVRLRETIAELEAFSYSLSHDMRSPLRSILSFSRFVLEDYGVKLEPPAREYLQKVIASARRMDRLIQDVLSFTRISRQEIQIVKVDVHRLIRDIIYESPELHPPAADVTIEGPLPPVLGHEASLTQCIVNLLTNAAKFVAPGVRPKVRISAEIIGGQVRLYIQDNGIGIEKDAQTKIFELFQRHPSRGGYEGTGLGLAIVRKAVERMFGQVGVESELGKGSRFWIQLPRAD